MRANSTASTEPKCVHFLSLTAPAILILLPIFVLSLGAPSPSPLNLEFICNRLFSTCTSFQRQIYYYFPSIFYLFSLFLCVPPSRCRPVLQQRQKKKKTSLIFNVSSGKRHSCFLMCLRASCANAFRPGPGPDVGDRSAAHVNRQSGPAE